MALLQKMNYVDGDKIVQLKGRVACEVELSCRSFSLFFVSTLLAFSPFFLSVSFHPSFLSLFLLPRSFLPQFFFSLFFLLEVHC